MTYMTEKFSISKRFLEIKCACGNQISNFLYRIKISNGVKGALQWNKWMGAIYKNWWMGYISMYF